jgi:hypothetical protein
MKKPFVPLTLFFIAFIFICVAASSGQQISNISKSPEVDRYYLRVSSCDDGGRAYVNGTLMVNVGFNEDSNWLDITEDLVKDKNKIKFEVVNKTGAITYLLEVKKNETIVYREACGQVQILGCENNRAFRVGVARSFTYIINQAK